MKKKTVWDMGRVSVEQFKASAKLPLTIVLDNVRSLNNIGSIFRSADGMAIAEVVLCGISQPPPSPEIHKTALGAEDSVAWRYFATTAEAVEALRAEGNTIMCLEQVIGSVALQDFVPESAGRYALIVGNEVDGVDPAVVDSCDMWIEIPQSGTKHSFNVAVSAALAMWHFYSHSLKNNN